MPGFDRTGPGGVGPMSGGGRGPCRTDNAREERRGTKRNCGVDRRRGFCGANARRGEGILRSDFHSNDVERLIHHLNQIESKLQLVERKLDESSP